MNTASQLIFGSFPRTVSASKDGILRQYCVHSEDEFDLFFDENRDKKNIYCNISRFREDLRPITGNVPFDFDSPLKESAFPELNNDKEKIELMRNDEELADEVLGEVWSDVQSLVSECLEREIPVISVFSGMGVHCHLLFQEEVNPTRKKTTTSLKLIEEADLNTHDRKIITDTKRILRVPNSQRVDKGEVCGLWCIPMTEQEVLSNSIHDLLDRSTTPKSIPNHERYQIENRPELKEYEDVEMDEGNVGTVDIETRDMSSEIDEEVEWIINNCIPLPCVRERFLSANPDHRIRFNGTVFLFQAGFSPKEVQQIISQIGWIDYDPKVTKKMTNQIYKRGYSEMSCSKLQSYGLCVYGPQFEEFGDEPSECPTHKYKSGVCLWQ